MKERRLVAVDYFPRQIDVATTTTSDQPATAPVPVPVPHIRDLSPRFQLFVFLYGEQQFYIDDMLFDMKAGTGPACQPIALIMCRTRRSVLTPVPKAGNPLRKVMISAPLRWMEDLRIEKEARSPELNSFVSGHLNHFVWRLQKHAIQLAEEIIEPPFAMTPEMRILFQKARAMELMCLACGALVEDAGKLPSKPAISTLRQSERVRDYVLEHLSEPLSIDTIARETGASVSSVQRHFKEHFGITVFDFIRRTRLEQARDALERQGTTIAQAAFIAGYTSTANFTTAFKKTYGVTPRYRRA